MRMVEAKDVDLLLALFHLCGNQVDGRKRLQKMVCVLKHKDNIPFSFTFKPYFYGPYSEELASLIEIMKGAGLLEEETSAIAPGIVQYRYHLLKKGERAFQSSGLQVRRNLLSSLRNEVQRLSNLPTSELVSLAKQQTLS
jgi:uncharacterized protein YwgA